MTFNDTYPAGFTRVGGSFPGLSEHDRNIYPVGTTSIPLAGNYDTTNTPSNITTWKILDATGTQVASGGAIAASGGVFPIPVGIRSTPGWYHAYLYNGSGVYMGGGMFVLEPAGTPWPTGGQYLTARLGYPGARMIIANAANPGVPNDDGWWNGGNQSSTAQSADYVRDHIADSSPWDTIDPVRKANRINIFAFRGFGGTSPEITGVTNTALRYAGLGFIYEGPNEPNGDSIGPSLTALLASFARAVWAGDSTARVAVPCPVVINRATIDGLTALMTALHAEFTSGEWAKIAVSFHDYNSGFDDLGTLDEVWQPWIGLLESVGLGSAVKVVTEHDALEAGHYGAGDLGHQLSRYSTLNMYAQLHVERERLCLFYVRATGQDDYVMFHVNDTGMPLMVVAWLLTQERETRQMVVAERHDAGTLSRIVLSIRYSKGDGSGVVQAKASGCPDVGVTYAAAGMTSGTLTKVDWQGRTSTVTVASGHFSDTLGPYPTFYRTPSGVTLTLVPAAAERYTEVAFISSLPGLGAAPSPVNPATSRESFLYNSSNPAGGVNYAWQGNVPFVDGQWVGCDAGTPFIFTGCEVYSPIPSHDVSSILTADLQVKVGGSWVAATKGGAPVTIDVDTPYQLVATTKQDGLRSWYMGYDTGAHLFVLDVDPVACTAWRVVVHSVTHGESPALETLRAAPGSGASGAFAPFAGAATSDHAGFGTETPYLHIAGLWTNGTAIPGVVPGGPVRYLVRAS